MSNIATQRFLKDKGGKNKMSLKTSQLWHNVESKPTNFVPRWVNNLEIK
jgi:hypothetical protein